MLNDRIFKWQLVLHFLERGDFRGLGGLRRVAT